MNKELLLENIKERELARKTKAKKDIDGIRKLSWVSYFAGEDYNEDLSQNQELKAKIGNNIIDFEQLESEKGDLIKQRITEICNDSKNNQLIKKGEYPIIWFKNVEKIKSKSNLESALLPIFDNQQNSKLFGQDLDLSKYILLATSSTKNIGKLSSPLTSRLDCINVKTAEPRSFFLDKNYGSVLVGSLVLVIFLLITLFWPNENKKIIN
ncbi:MAG: hypothetical protein mread185_000686 [Mycoplasmataceae bacterium]|nr:MAG: hypothetical protein mread185_000686 [Mycoplasmataceae bacterium]